MKYGIVAAGRFGDDIEDAFRIASEIGFDGLEIPFIALDYETELIWSAQGVARLRELSAQYNLEMPSCMGGRYNRRGFPDDDPSVREEAIELMLHLIGRCSQAGIGRILVAFFGDQALTSDERIRRAVEAMRVCAPEAESHGVTLALEGTVDAQAWLRMIDEIASPAMGVYYDVGNAVWAGLDGPAELRTLDRAGVLAQIHIKDMTVDKRNSPLGEGDVDWDAVCDTILDIGYDDYLVLETPSSDNPREDYADWLEFIRERTQS